jgi:hypothetical protein
MAGDAALHAHFPSEADERLGERFFHVLDLAVTGLADDPTGDDVTAVGEMDVLGDSRDAPPGDRFARRQDLQETGFLRALPQGLPVALQALVTARKGRVIGHFGPSVTVRAGDLQLRHVDLVLVSDRLLDVLGRAAASQDQQGGNMRKQE